MGQVQLNRHENFFDSEFKELERLPNKFTVNFESLIINSSNKTRVSIDDIQIGDIIDDNAYQEDFYRYHDVFHYTFAALLGWSPCTRAMMRRKRKSNPEIDEFEDGARATITEEAISLIIFNKAKQKNLYQGEKKISDSLLTQIKDLTSNLEVSVKSKKEWEISILKAYELFRKLVQNKGGKIHFNIIEQTANFEK